jgi:mitogen-activated protein kinase kinase kinase kinase 3
VSQPLSRTLAIELLDKANNPDHTTYNDFDDDDPEPEVQSPPQPLQLQVYPIKWQDED